MSNVEGVTAKMLTADIKIGDRARRDLGDIGALARDIEDIGLLQPIVVTPDGTLIAGARRLQAWSQSSMADDPIPVHIVDLEVIARGEFSENAMRKNFTVSEMVAMKRAIEPFVRAAAKINKRTHGGTTHGRKSQITKKLVTRDLVAEYCGLSATGLRKAEAVIIAAERSPARFAKIVSEMDRTGNIERAFRRLGPSAPSITSVRAAAKDRDIFDEILPPACAIGSAKAFDVIRNARFWGYLAAHMGIPPDQLMNLREFVKASLIEEALEYAAAKTQETDK